MDHDEAVETGTLEVGAHDGDETIELVDELLIEEISIDGMCGVY